MTDQDVIDLYRCLLGRAPENPGTIQAFRHYYSDFAQGRKAVFGSDEFQTFYAQVTGRVPLGLENAAGGLALSLLQASGGPASLPGVTQPGLRAVFVRMLERLEFGHLAVVVGELPGVQLADLVPLGKPGAAVLHVTTTTTAAAPRLATLPDGTTLFQLNLDPAGLAHLLQSRDQRVDALLLLGAPSDADWLAALQPRMAAQSLVVLGPATPTFPAASLNAALRQWRSHEPPLAWHGLTLHHFGGWHLPVTYAPPAAPPAAANQAAFPKLALAAIVKNEAACVVNMLASVRPIVGFYAILDTGSTDTTPKLVADFVEQSGVPFKLGALTSDRFDDMRNAALAMVPAEYPWILMLDADEELAPEDLAPLLQLIAVADGDAIALPRYNFPGADKSGEMLIYPDRQTRLLRNYPAGGVRYSGAVHETVRDVRVVRPPLDAAAIGGPRGGPHIHHLVRRFRDPAAEERKQEFYRQIARKHGGQTPGL